MSNNIDPTISFDPWRNLNQFTTARIGLGRAGISLPTNPYLDFQLAHAQARDAVNIALDLTILAQRINLLGYQSLTLQSQAENQSMYLQRPDLGRLLNKASTEALYLSSHSQTDIVIVVVDGLSSKAIDKHAVEFLGYLLTKLKETDRNLSPICLVKHGRVAIGDAVAEYLGAKLCIVLIGERPGLSSPDSMGIYFTYQAKVGVSTDADRNCISNIHSNGLTYQQALKKLLFLIQASEKLKLSGVNLKDESTDLTVNGRQNNFLIS